MDAEGGEEGEEGDGLKLDAELTAEELRMMQAMGIPFTFDTTQGRHVEDESVNVSGVKIKSKRTARQYMNRRGGFNRPLPLERTNERVVRD
jgi:U4/U6.U5 tri-snRNP-associated protein 3